MIRAKSIIRIMTRTTVTIFLVFAVLCAAKASFDVSFWSFMSKSESESVFSESASASSSASAASESASVSSPAASVSPPAASAPSLSTPFPAPDAFSAPEAFSFSSLPSAILSRISL